MESNKQRKKVQVLPLLQQCTLWEVFAAFNVSLWKHECMQNFQAIKQSFKMFIIIKKNRHLYLRYGGIQHLYQILPSFDHLPPQVDNYGHFTYKVSTYYVCF